MMNKVLRKRLPRDLKSNLGRYIALFLLIVMGMYIIVSIVGAAETIITQTAVSGDRNNVEDGEFTVFIPLTSAQKSELTALGADIEEMFSIDVSAENGSVVRVMKTRSRINLNAIDTGRMARADGEAVLEKRYCEENGISVGDNVKLSGVSFIVTGIGTTPDYDVPAAKLSDTADNRSFGLAFVTDSQYDALKAMPEQKTEEYSYAYKLSGELTDDELKSAIKALEFDYNDVEDKYFKDTIADTIGRKDELQDGIKELLDGAEQLRDGLSKLDENSAELDSGAQKIFEQYLTQASEKFTEVGITTTLTAENYAETLDTYITMIENAEALGTALPYQSLLTYALQSGSGELKALKATLDELKAFADGTNEYTDGVGEAYNGSCKLADGVNELKTETDKVIDEFFKVEIDNLTLFVKTADNPRIAGAAGDTKMNKIMGLAAGVVVMVLFTYVISVFVIHQVQRESSVIGALYALGAKKGSLIRHYITLPTLITFLGGVTGAALGFSELGIKNQMSDTYSYFSLPNFDVVYPVYLIIYSVIMPPLVSALVNGFVINKRLSQTALSLMRNEQHSSASRTPDLGKTGFINRFRIKQILREARTGFTVVFGMFISLLILMLGVDCYALCDNIKEQTKADLRYEYMYILKYPESSVPEGGEAIFVKSLSKTYLDYTLNIDIIGVDDDNKYFPVNPTEGKSSLAISSAAAQKYGIKIGDKLILTDSAPDMDYAFTVEDIADYNVGLTAFMDIDSMQELFGEEDDYYNALLSESELAIDEGRLYSVSTRTETERSADVFIELMKPMVTILIAVSVLIFCVVMFLMLNVMIDRAASGISLIKIFGYRVGEIKKLYLDGNMYIVFVGTLIGIPLSKALVDKMYPWLIANVACGMDLSVSPMWYAGIFVGVMAAYFIINAFLVGKLKRISPAEILKNRE